MLRRLLNLQVFGAIRPLSSPSIRINQAFGGVGASAFVDRSSLLSLVRIKGSSRSLSASIALVHQAVAPSSSDVVPGIAGLQILRRLPKLQVFGAVRLISSSTTRINQAICGVGAPVLTDRCSLLSLVQIKGSSRPLSGSVALAHQALPPSSSSNWVPGYNKLRVTELPRNATEESLRTYFAQFGMVLSCIILRDRETKESHRVAYVVFAYKEELNGVLATKTHMINGEEVRVSSVMQFTLLLGGVSPATTKESLRVHFSGYESFQYCGVRRNRCNGARSAFCNEAMACPHTIDGKEVDVRAAFPKEMTLFVGGLSPATTSDGLRSHFSSLGTLVQADVKQDRETGESSCFGYVTFSSQQELYAAIEAEPHKIDGKMVFLDYATKELQLFVTGPSLHTISEDRLEEYFVEKSCPLVRCEMARDKSTNRPLNHGWIMCSSQEILDRIMSSRPHSIDGKVVDVRLAGKRRSNECTLFVGNLPIGTTEEMLHDAFSDSGRIVGVYLARVAVTGSTKRFGFVHFDSVEGVRNALAARPHKINGVVVNTEASEKDRV